jgi:hypothetical protein
MAKALPKLYFKTGLNKLQTKIKGHIVSMQNTGQTVNTSNLSALQQQEYCSEKID